MPMLSQGRDRNLCAVCRHGDRAAIDFAIARGASSRTIETQYEIGRMTVQRHSATCLPAKVAVANALSNFSAMPRRSLSSANAPPPSY